jgi:hypothetical protein
MSEGSTMGNAQGWKMYNERSMGDSELAGFVGDRMNRADAAILSVEGPLHFMPSVITESVAGPKSPAGIHHAQTMRDE